MKKNLLFNKVIGVFLFLLMAVFLINTLPVAAQGSFTYNPLTDPDPAVFDWNGSIGYYGEQLIYAGDDGIIYAYDLDTALSTEVCDTSALATMFSSVAGFLVTDDNYLYFHDNSFPATGNIFRVHLTDTWPATYETLDTGCQGSIYCFTRNLWTDSVWFASADIDENEMYLYEVNDDFSAADLKASFDRPHGGGNGPIIFKGPHTLLYGESVWGGNGYFHLLNTDSGEIIQQDYITFSGGLASAAYGYNNLIFATTGSGRTIEEISGAYIYQVQDASDDAQGITFGNDALYVSEMSSDTGDISLHELTEDYPVTSVMPVDPYRAMAVAGPDPAAFSWNSSIARYGNQLIYTGDDGIIYAYDLDTALSTEVCDTSALAGAYSSVAGFLVTDDNYLYFHDNSFPTVNIYRLDLTDEWPATYETFDTGCSGSIYCFTQNPLTKAVWFASADLGESKMYLYKVNAKFTGAKLKASFDSPHEGGNGPIIFTGEKRLLYGESVWGGDGYFHLLNTKTGNIIDEDYITIPGGLASAAYGYGKTIYITSGDGRIVYKVLGKNMQPVAGTTDEAQGIVFDGVSFYLSTMDDSGNISFNSIWQVTQPCPEEITMLDPNGGETLLSGGSYTVEWEAPDNAAYFKLKYSMNNGASWTNIPGRIIHPNYSWTVPTPKKNKDKCLLKVTGFNKSGKKIGADKSDGTFTIETLNVTSPNGGEELFSGNDYKITWENNGTKKEVATVKIFLSKNGGKTWKIIEKVDGNPHTYTWTAPEVSKEKQNCRIKVVLKDNKGRTLCKDTSDESFTISPEPIG